MSHGSDWADATPTVPITTTALIRSRAAKAEGRGSSVSTVLIGDPLGLAGATLPEADNVVTPQMMIGTDRTGYGVGGGDTWPPRLAEWGTLMPPAPPPPPPPPLLVPPSAPMSP